MRQPAELAGPSIAVFDFDGTLTDRDMVGHFLCRTVGRRRFALCVIRNIYPLLRAAVLGGPARDVAKEKLIRTALTGRSSEWLSEHAESFAAHVVRSHLRDDTLALLREHQQLQHHVIFLSASLSCYLTPVGKFLGVDRVLATELLEESGRITGALAAPNVRGARKTVVLSSYLQQNMSARSIMYSYGDSTGDRYMLSVADHPVWVKRVPIHRRTLRGLRGILVDCR
ncbi:MAG TPA: HAD-IB family hydrolase [Acidimicrobiales bacterium]|nr:HAD-IB family hydrolase [Acidimicrobiales bacterium]